MSNDEGQPASRQGFSLVELLIVMAMIGVLAFLLVGSYSGSQARARDVRRKNDLKQIASSLELYYSDYAKYPDWASGQISCCAWGAKFTDGKTDYFVTLPKDPSGYQYYYRVVDTTTNQKFQLYAHLEYSSDKSCLNGADGKPSCTSPVGLPGGIDCGGGAVCNFSITNTKTNPYEN